MDSPLIIVDSDSKGKSFLEFFRDQADILVVSSPPFQLSHSCFINEEINRHDLTFSLTPLLAHEKFVGQLSANPERKIFIALDNDQPSEYISWLISSYLLEHNGHTGRVKRLDISGYCHDEIERAIDDAVSSHPESAREFYVRLLFNASLARHLQRLVGFSKGPGGRPLNYAALTTIFLLVDRKVEIKMYSAQKKWQIISMLGHGDNTLKAHLECAPDIAPKGVVKDLSKGKELVDLLAGKKFIVNKIERSELRIASPSPYTLAELCHDALVLYGIGPGSVLASLNKLYNGVVLDQGMMGLISSFTCMENDLGLWQETIRSCVTDLYGDEVLRNDVGEFLGSHILPLMPKITVEALSQLLDDESCKIYTLVRGKALASQMQDAVGSSLKLHIIEGDILFQAHINAITHPGFLAAHQGSNNSELMISSPFADIQEGDTLDFLGAMPEETVGSAAEHYTSETLFADLAEFSVPVDPGSLRMLQGMMDNDYVKVAKNGYLICSSSSDGVANYINRAFPKMVGVNLSAYIEQTVTEVLSGRKGLDFALKQFEQTLMIQGKILVKAKIAVKGAQLKRRSSSRIIKHVAPPTSVPESETLQEEKVKSVENAAKTVEVSGNKTIETEPEVVDSVVEEEAETDFESIVTPVDDGILSEEKSVEENEFDQPVSANDSVPETAEPSFVENVAPSSEGEAETVTTDQSKECQICGRPMILKKDQFGKFWNCSGFPACRHSETYHIQDEDVMTCPLCREAKIVTKRTPTGKSFFVCLGSACEFMAWSKPHSIPCQVCDFPYLVEKKSPQGRVQLRCPRAGCNYMQPLPGDNGHELLQEQKTSLDSELSSAPKKKRVVRRVKGKGTAGASSGKKKVRVIRRRK